MQEYIQQNQRGLRTRQGAEFQSSNIKRIIQHEGYTGYIITKAARSEFMPQLQIIDEALFTKANEMIGKRSRKALKDKNAAQKSGNPTLYPSIFKQEKGYEAYEYFDAAKDMGVLVEIKEYY